MQFARATGCSEVVLFHGDNREALVGDLSEFARCTWLCGATTTVGT